MRGALFFITVSVRVFVAAAYVFCNCIQLAARCQWPPPAAVFAADGM